jgi:hypothetical protein
MNYQTDAMYFSNDASLVLSHSVELVTLTGDSLVVADVYADSLINAFDASLIMRYSVDISVGDFPITPGLAKEAYASANVEWKVENVNDATGKFSLPIDLTGEPQNVFAIEVRTSLDPSLVELNSIASNLPEGWIMTNNNVDGNIVIAMAGTTPLNASRIAVLELSVLDKDAVVVLNGTVIVNANASKDLPSVELKQIPNKFALSQNYPNPFNPTTTINFEIAKEAKVNVQIYDLLGNKVITLVNTNKLAGAYNVMWNGLNNAGEIMPTGTYFYRITAGSFTQTKKMVLMK